MSSFIILILLITYLVRASASLRRPNIILVLADDLGYCEIEPYPCYVPAQHSVPRIATPNLSQFAREGLKFLNSYAGSPVCAPSRCTLMTGKHSGHATIRGNKDFQGGDWPLESTDVTVAELLRSVGYHTALIGKWGLGDLNTTGWVRSHGYDYFYGISDQNEAHNYYPEEIYENEKKVRLPLNKNASRERCMNEPLTCNYSHDLFVEKSLQMIRNRVKNAPDQPFFFFLSWTLPHAGGWTGVVEDGEPVPSNDPFGKTQWPSVEQDHAAMISSYLDRDFGRLMNLLKELQIDDETLVWFASDNGAHNEGGHSVQFFNSTGPLRGYKRSLYEGGIRTPQIIRWPAMIQPNTQTNLLTTFADFLPTLAQLGQVSNLPAGLDGVSIVPTLINQAKGQDEHLFVYFEFCTNDQWGNAVRFQNWKLVRFSLDQPYQLFDLDEDIGETNDLSEQYPLLVQLLINFAHSAHTDSEAFPVRNCVNSARH